MTPSPYTEDTLVQQTTVDYRERQLGWESEDPVRPRARREPRPRGQSEYYQAIRESSSRGESTPFVAFMLATILAAVRTPQEAPHVTPQVRRLVSVLAGEMSRRDILHALGLSDRKSLRQRYLMPALQDGYVEMTHPDAPTARNQKYRLTVLGRRPRSTV